MCALLVCPVESNGVIPTIESRTVRKRDTANDYAYSIFVSSWGYVALARNAKKGLLLLTTLFVYIFFLIFCFFFFFIQKGIESFQHSFVEEITGKGER
jgi:hypothetical protein